MTKRVKILLTAGVISLVVLAGCSSNIQKTTTNNVIYKIDDDVYVKSIILHKGKTAVGAEITQEIFVYCDENGKVTKNSPISFEEDTGKRRKTVSVIQ